MPTLAFKRKIEAGGIVYFPENSEAKELLFFLGKERIIGKKDINRIKSWLHKLGHRYKFDYIKES